MLEKQAKNQPQCVPQSIDASPILIFELKAVAKQQLALLLSCAGWGANWRHGTLWVPRAFQRCCSESARDHYGGTISTCGRGHLFYEMMIWPHNLLFAGEELLSVCTEHNVSVSAWGLEKGVCAHRACPFFPPKIVPLSAKLSLPRSSHSAHAIHGRSPGISKWEDVLHWSLEWSEVGFTSAKTALIWRSGSLCLREYW